MEHTYTGISKKIKGIINEISAERNRQILVEGYTIGSDDEDTEGQLALAAASYALHAAGRADIPWPWSMKYWKPKDPRRDLIRAGALIVAEIERLDRAAKP
jgi:hypothetical protein